MNAVAMQTHGVVERLPASHPVLGPVTPLDMLNQAVASGAGIDVLSRLMDLHERWEKGQARKDFDEAVADAKREIAPVTRNKSGHNDKRYADFAAIASAVDPVIGKFGLSYRFRTQQTDRISVTCILSHKSGHFEETTLSGPADASGSKNAIQAIGSTLTYLQRYSLIQMLGLSVTDDDDGKAAGIGEVITEEQVIELRDIIESVEADEVKFAKFMKVAKLSELPAARYADAKRELAAFSSRNGRA